MDRVMLCEMSPRDGLQALGGPKEACRLVALEQKLALIAALVRARLPYIEVGAFVSPKVMPQMADSDTLARRIPPPGPGGPQLAALAPNLRQYERIRSTPLDTCALFVSASQEYSRRNMNATLDETLGWAAEVAAAARADGRRLRAHLSGAFQEVYTEGDSDLQTVCRAARRLIEFGCEHVALADTNGTTNPRRVRAVVAACATEIGVDRVAVHLHDRGGLGLANALAAFDAGVRTFDAAVGGLGGSATAAADGKRPPGNIATEELAHLFERLGVATGVDPAALLDAGRIAFEITQATGDPPPPGRLLREALGYTLGWHASTG